MDKYHVPLAPAGAPRTVPFRRLYLLARAEDGADAAISRLRGQRAMEAVMSQTYRALNLGPMGLAGRHFRQCAALLADAEVHEGVPNLGLSEFAAGKRACSSGIATGGSGAL